jgi:hypothetical protein
LKKVAVFFYHRLHGQATVTAKTLFQYPLRITFFHTLMSTLEINLDFYCPDSHPPA